MMRLHLSSRASLRGPRGERTLERKEAALLAYLALEGATSRSRLAGLLWPDGTEERARANLRQLLHRLGDLRSALSGSDPLRLSRDVDVDDISDPDDLLGDHDYADCPQLQEWLDTARHRVRQARLASLERELDEAERRGDIGAARRHAERILEIDPYSELRVRRLVALFLRWGDRPAAQRLYALARQRLADDLGSDDDILPLVARTMAGETGGGITPLLEAAATLDGPGREAALLRLDASLPEWRAAWLAAVETGDARLLAEAAAPLALYFEHRPHPEQGLELLMRAAVRLELRDDPPSRRALGRLLVHTAWLRHRLGLDATEVAARGVTLLRDLGDARALAQGLYALGAARWYAGDTEAARAAWEEAASWLPRGTDPAQAQQLHGNLAMAADALGDLERARHHYRSALDLCRRASDTTSIVPYLNNLGQLLVRLGRPAEAEDLLNEGLRLACAAGGPRELEPYLLDSLAGAAMAAGRLEQAARLLRAAEARVGGRADRRLAIDLRLTRARLALAADEPALPSALAALSEAWKLDHRPAVADALLLVARALLAVQATEGAHPILAALLREGGPGVRSEAARLLPEELRDALPLVPLARLVPRLLAADR